jgi:hypothetical protein
LHIEGERKTTNTHTHTRNGKER